MKKYRYYEKKFGFGFYEVQAYQRVGTIKSDLNISTFEILKKTKDNCKFEDRLQKKNEEKADKKIAYNEVCLYLFLFYVK